MQRADVRKVKIPPDLGRWSQFGTEKTNPAPRQPMMRTVAVMMTDMVASTAFAERHGAVAAYVKRQQHNQLLSSVVTEVGGRLVEFVGDSMLAIFDRVEDAARCGVAIQRVLAEYNATETDIEDLEIHVRIAIHYGKTLVAERPDRIEICGRTVNVTARVLEASPGDVDEVSLSDDAVAELANRAGFYYEFARMMHAKGVGPIRIHRVRRPELVRIELSTSAN